MNNWYLYPKDSVQVLFLRVLFINNPGLSFGLQTYIPTVYTMSLFVYLFGTSAPNIHSSSSQTPCPITRPPFNAPLSSGETLSILLPQLEPESQPWHPPLMHPASAYPLSSPLGFLLHSPRTYFTISLTISQPPSAWPCAWTLARAAEHSTSWLLTLLSSLLCSNYICCCFKVKFLFKYIMHKMIIRVQLPEHPPSEHTHKASAQIKKQITPRSPRKPPLCLFQPATPSL